jgi:hypothetical protein
MIPQSILLLVISSLFALQAQAKLRAVTLSTEQGAAGPALDVRRKGADQRARIVKELVALKRLALEKNTRVASMKQNDLRRKRPACAFGSQSYRWIVLSI